MSMRSLPRLSQVAEEDRESGMTLVELMWAMVIFAIVATAAVAGLSAALQSSRLDRNRVAASGLAARELEIVRNAFTATSSGPTTLAATTLVTNPDPLPGGSAGQPLVVDGVPYTVVRNVEWLPAGSGQSPCDGGSSVTYPSLAVKVSVTWTSMGNVQPVQSNTILTPPKGTLASNTGFVAAKIMNSAGVPAPNQTVTMTGPGGTFSDTTASDGCAVFATTTAGTYTVAINVPGYVDLYGNQNSTRNVVVSAGTIQVVPMPNYDRAITLNETMVTQGGYNLPTSLPWLTLGNTALQPSGIKIQPATGTTTAITGLYPFTDGYTSWVSSCQQGDPAASGGTRDAAVVTSPGGTQNDNVSLAPVLVTLKNALGLPITGATVSANPVNTTSCQASDLTVTLGTTDSNGQLKTSFPAGAWTIKVAGRTVISGGTTPVLLPNGSPVTQLVTTS